MFKRKNGSVEQGAQPEKKRKKKRKWIIIAVVAFLFIFIIGSSDDSDSAIPTIEENMSEHLEFYTEKKEDGLTMKWYKIDTEDISRVDDYVELLCEDYDFETVDGNDNDYYLYYTEDNEFKTLYTDSGNKEYHIRIGIGDEGEDRSLIAFIYADGLFSDNESDDKAEKTADVEIDKQEEKTEQATDAVIDKQEEKTEQITDAVIDKQEEKTDSQNASGGSGLSVPTVNRGNKICAVCKNRGKVFCNRCNGSGKIVNRGSIAGFGTDDKKSFSESKGDCPQCFDGYKDCTYCD